jgi:hypothetical protein
LLYKSSPFHQHKIFLYVWYEAYELENDFASNQRGWVGENGNCPQASSVWIRNPLFSIPQNISKTNHISKHHPHNSFYSVSFYFLPFYEMTTCEICMYQQKIWAQLSKTYCWACENIICIVLLYMILVNYRGRRCPLPFCQ